MKSYEISNKALESAHMLRKRAKEEARRMNCRIYSRGFEFLSLDEKQERDEQLVEYYDDHDMSPELVEQALADCRKVGAKYLAIGYGVDAAQSIHEYEDGDYEPMFDWVDLPNIEVQ